MQLITGIRGTVTLALVGAIILNGCATTTETTTETNAGAAPSNSTTTSTPPPQQTSGGSGGWPSMRTSEGTTWTSMAFPTGDAKTSVVGVEKGHPREVRVGQSFDYDIIVTNLTSKQVEDVVVTDQANTNFKLAKSTPEGHMNSAGVMSWNVGDLKPGESKTIRVTGAASGEGNISSCATCTYSSTLCAAIPVVSPKLRLLKTGPAEIAKCEPITYTFEISNVGTGSISNVKIADPLPAGLALPDGKKSIDINVGLLAPGASKKFTASVTADKTGTYDNKATASGDGGLVAESSGVSTIVYQPVLTVDAECPKDTLIGRDLTFKYTIKSTGDTPSANTTLVATLPAGATSAKADNNGAISGGKVTWNLGALAEDASKTVSVTLRTTTAGTLQTSATAQGVCATAVTDSCSVTVQGVPDIGISLKDDTGVRLVGDNHIFTYTVKNQGQVDLTNVTMNATLSAGLEFVSSTSPVAPKGGGRAVSWNLGTLKVGQDITFAITAKGIASGEQSIDTVTKSDQLQLTSDAGEQVNFITR